MSKVLIHYGMPRRSGRYPWGSGKDPQRNRDFLSYIGELKKEGMSDTKIAEKLGMTSRELKARRSVARANVRENDVAYAISLKEKGMSNVAIGEKMGINESSVRSLLNPSIQARQNATQTTADILKERLEQGGYIDVGVGVERHMGISRERLMNSLTILKDEGYVISNIQIEQLGTDNNKTTVMTLAPPGTTYVDIVKNTDAIGSVAAYSQDGGQTYDFIKPPTNISKDRIHIRYGEEGGSDNDGVIELRPGVDDISLGNSKYAQVRIAVDNEYYLKGMAIYSDDIPAGKDIIFNSNKPKGTPIEDVYKSLKNDPDNPFGATVRQKTYLDKDGKEKLSALNIVNEEGDWDKWSKNISSQMLSKQTPALAKQQLSLAFDIKKAEFDEIMSLNNPAIKKKLLESFADDMDASAVHLKAAAMPRQKTQVILPVNSLKDNEIYAPNFNNGETVVLVRYPHGGIFEIPQLKVNNRNPEAKKMLSAAKDAVGINSKVAERLSGADFDGDTVLVIPNNHKQVKVSAPLKGLVNFNPKDSYPAVKDMKIMTSADTQREMGKISNLITDMTIKGATDSELASAVRHSMVVIDAEKHKLNYTKSATDNRIADLKRKYQGGANAGASTLISKASAEARPKDRKRHYEVDPKTGKKIFEYTNETYVNKQGKTVYRTTKSKQMYETEDAFSLSSGTVMETIYATHANKLKALGNQARKENLSVRPTQYSASANRAYKKEEQSLTGKLNIALKNAPVERQAQIIANNAVAIKRQSNPDLTKQEVKRLKAQELDRARARTGAKKIQVEISPSEWKAIQAGAISNNKLTQILDNTDLDKVKALATPRTKTGLSNAKATRARGMLSRGYTQAEVASALGISLTTLQSAID